MTTGIDQHDQGGDDYDHEGIAQNDDHDYKLKENLQDVQRSGRQPSQLDNPPGSACLSKNAQKIFKVYVI